MYSCFKGESDLCWKWHSLHQRNPNPSILFQRKQQTLPVWCLGNSNNIINNFKKKKSKTKLNTLILVLKVLLGRIWCPAPTERELQEFLSAHARWFSTTWRRNAALVLSFELAKLANKRLHSWVETQRASRHPFSLWRLRLYLFVLTLLLWKDELHHERGSSDERVAEHNIRTDANAFWISWNHWRIKTVSTRVSIYGLSYYQSGFVLSRASHRR